MGSITCDEGDALRHSSHALDPEEAFSCQRVTHHLDLKRIGIPEGTNLHLKVVCVLTSSVDFP